MSILINSEETISYTDIGIKLNFFIYFFKKTDVVVFTVLQYFMINQHCIEARTGNGTCSNHPLA